MSLGEQTAAAIRFKSWRRKESPQERQQRLLQDRERHAAARAAESDERRQQRLARVRARTSAARAVESDERRQLRLAQNRLRNAAARAVESDERRLQRLARLRANTSAARAVESDERRQQRLAQDRARNAAARAAKKRIQELPQIQDEEPVPRSHSFLSSVCDALEEAVPVDIKVEVVDEGEEYAIVGAAINDRPPGDNRQCGAIPLKRSDVCQKTGLSNQAPSYGRSESRSEKQQRLAQDRERKAAAKRELTRLRALELLRRLTEDREREAAARRDQPQEKRLRRILPKTANSTDAPTQKLCLLILSSEGGAESRGHPGPQDVHNNPVEACPVNVKVEKVEEDPEQCMTNSTVINGVPHNKHRECSVSLQVNYSLEFVKEAAIQSKLWRRNESPQERQQRPFCDRERHAAARAAESDERCQQRIAQNRARTSAARAVELDERLQQRHTQNRARKAAARANESDKKRQLRLAQDRARRAAARAVESDERRQQRLAQNRARTAAARAAKKRIQELPLIQDEESVPRSHSFPQDVHNNPVEACPVNIKVEVEDGQEECMNISTVINGVPHNKHRERSGSLQVNYPLECVKEETLVTPAVHSSQTQSN